MSGIYIQMEMPKNCRSCRLATYEMNYGYICKVLNTDVEDGVVFKPWKNRRKDCPLISVPPHGRLIDADELLQEHERIVDSWGKAHIVSAQAIRNAPTIIPADRTEVIE